MPGEDIQSWSATAASNGTADTLINWAEGQPRASVNNSARSMMAAHAKDRNLKNGSITTAGTANAQTFSSGLGYTTVPTGLVVKLKIAFTNTGAMTLNMDGIGAVVVKDQYGLDTAPGLVLLNSYADFLYNGTNWILLGPQGQANVPAFVATLAADQGSWPAGTWIPGLFRAASVNVGSYFNVTNGRWTPPAGSVLIGGNGEFSNIGTLNFGYIGIYKNGAAIRRQLYAGISTILGLGITTIDIANGTDYYECYFNLGSIGGGGATLGGGALLTNFYGYQT